MSEVTTRKDTDEVLSVIRDFMKQVDDRFQSVENQLANAIDGFIGRIDKYEVELAARDAQFERLVSWARKVSKKTDIPLESL